MFKFQHPFTAVIAGPTRSGKTQLVKKIIEERLIYPFPTQIVWYFMKEQHQLQRDLPEVEFRRGPDIGDLNLDGRRTLIVMDDMMREAGNDVTDIFTKGSHHDGVSVIFVTQNIYHQRKGRRDQSLNTHYVVVFKNPADRAQISHLARQCKKSKLIEDAYDDAAAPPHGYLVIDHTQETPDELRVVKNIDTPSPVYFVYK